MNELAIPNQTLGNTDLSIQTISVVLEKSEHLKLLNVSTLVWTDSNHIYRVITISNLSLIQVT
jgi:hypothetical protein